MYHHSKRKSAFLAVVSLDLRLHILRIQLFITVIHFKITFQVVVQVIMTVVALILASLITAGFVNTCETVLNDVL